MVPSHQCWDGNIIWALLLLDSSLISHTGTLLHLLRAEIRAQFAAPRRILVQPLDTDLNNFGISV